LIFGAVVAPAGFVAGVSAGVPVPPSIKESVEFRGDVAVVAEDRIDAGQSRRATGVTGRPTSGNNHPRTTWRRK
jgi:hypothetical protein